MATVTDDLYTYLAAQFPTETFQIGFLQPDPDRAIALVERPTGAGEAETFVGPGRGPKINMEQPTIQILVRTPPDDYRASRQLADDLYQALHNLTTLVLSGTRYALIEATQPPYNVGIDEQGRWLIAFGITCWKRPN